jgi:capsular exopolysaccharide synthesis family protein
MSRVFQALERVEGSQGRKGAAVLSRSDEDDGGHRASPDLAEFERLASAVLQAHAAAPFTTLMVAAPDHGEGTSTVAVGLARALAGRLAVLLVDGNLRSPGLAEILRVDAPQGLVEALSGRGDVETFIADTRIPNLRLLAAGDVGADSPRLLGTAKLGAVMARLRGAAELVIVDAAPVVPYADALIVASSVERIVVVTQAEHTQRGDLERAKHELDKSGAAILGVVLNRKASHAPPWLQRRLNL